MSAWVHQLFATQERVIKRPRKKTTELMRHRPLSRISLIRVPVQPTTENVNPRQDPGMDSKFDQARY